ncbi:MAG TPA: carbohydrate-binding family 9-like protein [Flavisolibacter sp.]|nr:carbohydrate-binding family 9-like protein [Flavisolibacter sp.]
MNKLTVPFLDHLSSTTSIAGVADSLRKLQKQSIDCTPWKAYPYKPDVHFSIAYNAAAVLLQYTVREEAIRAACGNINDPVYKDSCVEFFICLDDDASYYNFEFNCIGTVLAGFGKGREEREILHSEALQKIKRQVCISRGEGPEILWEITIAIPLETFLHHAPLSLKEKNCRANFYKCGDELPEPHFLSWTNIGSSEPNFHLPEFFGVLQFQ